MREWKSLKIMFKITVFPVALSLCVPAIGKIIYVDAGAVGANNGSGERTKHSFRLHPKQKKKSFPRW